MSIDFSKAPGGATHYYDFGCGSLWYRCGVGAVEFWHNGVWVSSGEFHSSESLTAIPTFEPFVSVEDAPTPGSKHGPEHDPVNRPTHYASGGIECIVAIKASMSQEAFLGYLKGNVQKYLWRYEKKVNPVEDLKKARWYLDRLIAEQE